MTKKFLVTVQLHYTRDVTYEVEATCEENAYGEVLKGKQLEVFSMEAIMPSSLINVKKVIPRTKFACADCPDSYSTATNLDAHMDITRHRPALDN